MILELSSGQGLGTLIVAVCVVLVALAIVGENLRGHLSSVAKARDTLARDLLSAQNELLGLISANDAKAATLQTLEADIERKAATLETLRAEYATRAQAEAQNLVVLDQTVQPNHAAWIVDVDREGEHAPELWSHRRYLVFSDDRSSALKRLEARFPPAAGFRLGSPIPFGQF
jgi:hypothetical protein